MRQARQNKEKGNIFVLKRNNLRWKYRIRSYDDDMQRKFKSEIVYMNFSGVASSPAAISPKLQNAERMPKFNRQTIAQS